MTIADDAHNRRTVVQVGAMLSDLFTMVAQEAQRSIVEGSELTGAPGQPVDTGYLKGSWQLVFDGQNTAIIGTNTDYAEYIEDGIVTARSGQVTGHTKQRLTLRSEVGGFHSVKLTEAGIPKIIAAVTERVKATHGDRA